MRETVIEILRKYDFTSFLGRNNVDQRVALELNTYSGFPGAIGSFKDERSWIVYECGPMGTIYNKRIFGSQGSAYRELAKRLGLNYKEDRLLKEWKSLPLNLRKALLNKARNYYETLNKEMEPFPEYYTGEASFQLLSEELHRLEKENAKARLQKILSQIIRTSVQGKDCVFAYENNSGAAQLITDV